MNLVLCKKKRVLKRRGYGFVKGLIGNIAFIGTVGWIAKTVETFGKFIVVGVNSLPNVARVFAHYI